MGDAASATYDTLTSLRGLACFMVIIFHCEQAHGFDLIPDTPILSVRQFFTHGYMWVDLFFVISGYVLTSKYANLFRSQLSLTAYLLFLRRRFARTYPMYLVSYCAAYLVFALIPHHYNLWSVLTLLSNLAMIQVWGLSSSINSPSWSLSGEWLAYAAFPLIVIVLNRNHMTFWLGIFACVAGIAVMACTQNRNTPTGCMDYHDYFDIRTSIRCVVGFSLGAVGVLLPERLADCIERHGRGLRLFAIIATPITLSIPHNDWSVLPAYFLLVVTAGLRRDGFARGPFSRLFYPVGVVSYSIYLLHDMLLHDILHPEQRWIPFAPDPASGWLAHLLSLLIALPLLFVVGRLGYALVEVPGRALLAPQR
jgi:peptidoglycan/LPS O-acetylase OafA/YrhL